MARKQKVLIEKDPENKIDVRVMEQAIVDVAEAAKKLNSSRLTQKAIILLLHDAIGARAISRQQIADVLHAAETLGRTYLK